MAEVLETVCRKRDLRNPKDYSLVLDLNPVKLFIPVDRTVKSLQGKRDLMLIKKNMLQTYGVEMGKKVIGRSIDPNGVYYPMRLLTHLDNLFEASIFKRASEVPEQTYSTLFDYTTAYKVRLQFYVCLHQIDYPRGSTVHCIPQSSYACYSQCTNTRRRRWLYPCLFSTTPIVTVCIHALTDHASSQ